MPPLSDVTAENESRPDVVRLTSLFGGSCEGVFVFVYKIGAAEPCDIVMDGESGPMLDLGLSPFVELCIDDNLFIHDMREETLSFLVSGAIPCPGEPSDLLLLGILYL